MSDVLENVDDGSDLGPKGKPKDDDTPVLDKVREDKHADFVIGESVENFKEEDFEDKSEEVDFEQDGVTHDQALRVHDLTDEERNELRATAEGINIIRRGA